MAISYILKARKFNDKVRKARHFGPVEREEMDDIMKHLEEEFNSLRDKQPVIMDSMLETLENLKTMRRNFEADPDVYDFDYISFLDNTVTERQKVYEHKKLDVGEKYDNASLSSENEDKQFI